MDVEARMDVGSRRNKSRKDDWRQLFTNTKLFVIWIMEWTNQQNHSPPYLSISEIFPSGRENSADRIQLNQFRLKAFDRLPSRIKCDRQLTFWEIYKFDCYFRKKKKIIIIIIIIQPKLIKVSLGGIFDDHFPILPRFETSDTKKGKKKKKIQIQNSKLRWAAVRLL